MTLCFLMIQWRNRINCLRWSLKSFIGYYTVCIDWGNLRLSDMNMSHAAEDTRVGKNAFTVEAKA